MGDRSIRRFIELLPQTQNPLTGSRELENAVRSYYAIAQGQTIKADNYPELPMIKVQNTYQFKTEEKTKKTRNQRRIDSNYTLFRNFVKGVKPVALMLGDVSIQDIISGSAKVQRRDAIVKVISGDGNVEVLGPLKIGKWPKGHENEDAIRKKYAVNPITGQVFTTFLMYAGPFIMHLQEKKIDPLTHFVFRTLSTLVYVGMLSHDPLIRNGKLHRANYTQAPAVALMLAHLMPALMKFTSESAQITVAELVLKQILNPFEHPQTFIPAIKGFSYGSPYTIQYVGTDDVVQKGFTEQVPFNYWTKEMEEQAKKIKDYGMPYTASKLRSGDSQVIQVMNDYFTPFYNNYSGVWKTFFSLATISSEAERATYPYHTFLTEALSPYAAKVSALTFQDLLRFGASSSSSGSAGVGTFTYAEESRGKKKVSLKAKTKGQWFTQMQELIPNLSPLVSNVTDDIDKAEPGIRPTVIKNMEIWKQYTVLKDPRMQEILNFEFPRYSIKNGMLFTEKVTFFSLMAGEINLCRLGVRTVPGKADRLFFAVPLLFMFDLLAHLLNADLAKGYLGTTSAAGLKTANVYTYLTEPLKGYLSLGVDSSDWDKHLPTLAFRIYKLYEVYKAYKSNPNPLLLLPGLTLDWLRSNSMNLVIKDDVVYDKNDSSVVYGLAINPCIYTMAILVRQAFLAVVKQKDIFLDPEILKDKTTPQHMETRALLVLFLFAGMQLSGLVDTLAMNTVIHSSILRVAKDILAQIGWPVHSTLALGDDGLISFAALVAKMDARAIERWKAEILPVLSDLYYKCGHALNPQKQEGPGLAKKFVDSYGKLTERDANLVSLEHELKIDLPIQIAAVKERLSLWCNNGLDPNYAMRALVAFTSLMSLTKYDRERYIKVEKMYYPVSFLFTEMKLSVDSLLIDSPLSLPFYFDKSEKKEEDLLWLRKGHDFFNSYLDARRAAADKLKYIRPNDLWVNLYANVIHKNEDMPIDLRKKVATERFSTIFKSAAMEHTEMTILRRGFEIKSYDFKMPTIALKFTPGSIPLEVPAKVYVSQQSGRVLALGIKTSKDNVAALNVVRRFSTKVDMTEEAVLRKYYAAAQSKTDLDSFFLERGANVLDLNEIKDTLIEADPLLLIDALENPWGKSFIAALQLGKVLSLITITNRSLNIDSRLAKAPFALFYIYLVSLGLKLGTVLSIDTDIGNLGI